MAIKPLDYTPLEAGKPFIAHFTNSDGELVEIRIGIAFLGVVENLGVKDPSQRYNLISSTAVNLRIIGQSKLDN